MRYFMLRQSHYSGANYYNDLRYVGLRDPFYWAWYHADTVLGVEGLRRMGAFRPVMRVDLDAILNPLKYMEVKEEAALECLQLVRLFEYPRPPYAQDRLTYPGIKEFLVSVRKSPLMQVKHKIGVPKGKLP